MAKTDTQSLRTPPHNLEAEQAVLGTFYLRNDAVASVYRLLKPEDFYDPRHQEIFRTIIGLFEANKPIDPTILINEMERLGILERAGGPAYLVELEQAVISPGNVMHHAGIVHEKSLLRRLIHAASEISSDAYEEKQEAEGLLAESERKIFDIIQGRQTTDFSSFGEVIQEVYEDVVRRSENRQEVTGISTGYTRLDRMTGGFQSSDLIILAARPSMGKTSLALNIVMNAAKRTRSRDDGSAYHPAVAVFSLEMSRTQVAQRMICTEAKIPMELLRKNMMTHRQLEKFNEVSQQVMDLPIFINDSPGMDPTELRLQAQHLQMRYPDLSLVIIDYLQLMTLKRSRPDSRQQEVSEISRSLKALARDLNVPVVALSQLSRNIENRRGIEREPKLSDLRESGAIEQDADVVMFIHRERRIVEQEEGDGNRNEPQVAQADLIIAKQRNGPVGRVGMLFREDCTEFRELTQDRREE
jgi:replicative DNA helicase